MGWGEAHRPQGSAGTTKDIETAFAALAAVDVHAPTLALAAIEAAGVIDRLRSERSTEQDR